MEIKVNYLYYLTVLLSTFFINVNTLFLTSVIYSVFKYQSQINSQLLLSLVSFILFGFSNTFYFMSFLGINYLIKNYTMIKEYINRFNDFVEISTKNFETNENSSQLLLLNRILSFKQKVNGYYKNINLKKEEIQNRINQNSFFNKSKYLFNNINLIVDYANSLIGYLLNNLNNFLAKYPFYQDWYKFFSNQSEEINRINNLFTNVTIGTSNILNENSKDMVPDMNLENLEQLNKQMQSFMGELNKHDPNLKMDGSVPNLMDFNKLMGNLKMDGSMPNLMDFNKLIGNLEELKKFSDLSSQIPQPKSQLNKTQLKRFRRNRNK